MMFTTLLKKSLLTLVATAPLVVAPSCTEKPEQRTYKREVIKTEAGRVVGFRVFSDTREESDILYYEARLYKGHELREQEHKRYAVAAKTQHPDSEGQTIYVHNHLPRSEIQGSLEGVDEIIFEFYSSGFSNTEAPPSLTFCIRPEDMPLYAKDRDVAAAKNALKTGK